MQLTASVLLLPADYESAGGPREGNVSAANLLSWGSGAGVIPCLERGEFLGARPEVVPSA